MGHKRVACAFYIRALVACSNVQDRDGRFRSHHCAAATLHMPSSPQPGHVVSLIALESSRDPVHLQWQRLCSSGILAGSSLTRPDYRGSFENVALEILRVQACCSAHKNRLGF